MKPLTVSINPENQPTSYNEAMQKALGHVFKRGDIPKDELLNALLEYSCNYFAEVLAYSEKYPNSERLKEYVIRHELICQVYNQYGNFYWDAINSKREMIKLKIKSHHDNLKILDLQAEIEKLTKTIEGEI